MLITNRVVIVVCYHGFQDQMSYHMQSAQAQSVLYRVLQLSCVVSHLSEHYGKDKNAPSKPLLPSRSCHESGHEISTTPGCN